MSYSLDVPVHSLEDLFVALARGEVQRLLGTRECLWLDFKTSPYQLDKPRGVRDLVADVAAFANGTGGVIVIGVETQKREGTNEEVAKQIRGVAADLVDEDRLRALLRAHVQPLVHIEISRARVTADRELVAIKIDEQPDRDRPYLVDRVTDLEGRNVPHAIGWPTRHGSDTHWETSGRIQQLIANGRGSSGARPVADTSSDPIEDALRDHLILLDQQVEWEEWPRIIVQAIPENPSNQISDFFGGFVTKMGQRKNVRELGFGLHLSEGELRPDAEHLIAASDRQFVAIDRTGVVTAAANGTPEMLGWGDVYRGSRGEINEAMVASPYVVVEFPTEVVRLVEEEITSLVGAESWTFRVIGQRFRGGALPMMCLRPKPKESGRGHETREPIVDSFSRDVTSTGEIFEDAFKVVAEIYGSGFGCGHSEVPFAEGDRIRLDLMN